jgi:N6-L-threonylcarbamoyladenine synthase
MRILGIETSCDETAIAVVQGNGDVLQVEQNIVSSQIKTHEKYGGVVPEVAARMHLKKIIPMIREELPKNGEEIDAIAVTAGPGLSPALRTGVEVAKTLAWSWGKPLIGVSHLEGHIYTNWLGDEIPQFPALCLIVSGGHTELILMKNHGEFKRIGETLDDAAGEAFDKVAKMLGLSYPGGPHIQKLAEEGNSEAFDFPRGLLDRPNLDFSFSGIKTSVLYTLRENQERLDDEEFRANIAASFQEAVVDVLVRKTKRAADKYKPASVLLAGGVAANSVLRERLDEYITDIPVFVPPMKYATDNAAMIAAAGYFRSQDQKNFIDPLLLKANPNLDF